MATVDLADLVPDIIVALNIPGEDAYATVSPETWVGYLKDGFWNAILEGLLVGYTEEDGVISSTVDDTAMPRDLQQLIIMYTSIAVLRNKLFSLQTLFRAKAGPVEYEVQQSAQVMKALLDEFSERRRFILQRLADTGSSTDIYYIDSYIARQEAIDYGLTEWIGA